MLDDVERSLRLVFDFLIRKYPRFPLNNDSILRSLDECQQSGLFQIFQRRFGLSPAWSIFELLDLGRSSEGVESRYTNTIESL